MAKKNINKRCPLSIECERKTCDFVNTEHKCDYYKYNARPGYTIPDQEEILELQRKQLDMELEDELNTNDLIYIPVTRLFPHPDNPRKDLGDLTELANSIKEKGILQNLTVVPRREGTYTVIIGHRRLAAAKAAGLVEVPCIITEMSPQEQVATMLLENIQRSDLTLYEQAQGFQMMIDFGENVESISKKTGLSESTVRRRVKLSELNQDTLKKVSNRQINIGDLDRLSKIEDEKERNKVLGHIGTNNFENEFTKAINEQKRQKRYDLFRAPLFELGLTELEESDFRIHNHEKGVAAIDSLVNDIVSLAKELIEEGKTVFFKFSYDWIYIYTKKQNTPPVTDVAKVDADDIEDEQETDAQAQARQERERQEKLCQLKEIRRGALNEAFKRVRCLRFDFVKKLSEAQAKSYATEIVKSNLKLNIEDAFYYGLDVFAELMNIDTNKENEELYTTYEKSVQTQPYKSLFAFTYASIDYTHDIKCFNPNDLSYAPNDAFKQIYDLITTIGYDPSDEEIQLLNGSSPLYLKENDNQDNI